MINNNSGILLIGGNGLVGKKVTKTLIKNGFKGDIKITTRNVNKRDETLDPSIKFVEFDFNKPETFKGALEDVDKLYLIIPPSDLYADKTITPFIEYLRKEGNKIKQIIFLSGSTNDEGLPVIPSENLVKSLGVDYVIVCPTSFTDNFLTYMSDSIKRGLVINQCADGKTAYNCTDDIAEVCGILLSNDQIFNKYKNKSITLSSSESITFGQAIELFNKHLNKTITVKEVTLDEYEEMIKSYNVPESNARFLTLIYGCIRNGNVDYVDNNIQDITGHKPISLEEYIISNLAHWK